MRRNNLLLAGLIIPLLLAPQSKTTDRGDRVPGVRSSPQTKLGRALAEELAARKGNRDPLPVWVYFTDKGAPDTRSVAAALTLLERTMDPRCARRRSKMLAPRPLVGQADLPLAPVYVDSIRRLAGGLRAQSRWLNAVSVEVRPLDIRRIAGLPHVRKVDLVRSFTRSGPLSSSPAPGESDTADPVIGLYGPTQKRSGISSAEDCPAGSKGWTRSLYQPAGAWSGRARSNWPRHTSPASHWVVR